MQPRKTTEITSIHHVSQMTQDDLVPYCNERAEELAQEISASPVESFSAAIDAFVRARLQIKLEKLKPDDTDLRNALIAQHDREVWLEDAARRVNQIQAVTHSLKAIHPSARGTNLLVWPDQLPSLRELGSHALAQQLSLDVVGPASALDVYKLLRLQVDGCTLLSALVDHDPEAMSALHSDKARSQLLRNAFVSLVQPRQEPPSSHALAKQVYWLTGTDACRDDDFTLLGPLYATSLMHVIHGQIDKARYGQANKLARQAKREGRWHEGVYEVYPALATTSLGGAQPQNISQLNSERKGINYLLSSQPPARSAKLRRLPASASSVFDGVYSTRPLVKRAIEGMQSSPENASVHLETLLDELVLLGIRMQQHAPGWTRDAQQFGRLHASEQLWLDPLRAELPDQQAFAAQWLEMQWPAEVGDRFEKWLIQTVSCDVGPGCSQMDWKELLVQDDSYERHLRVLHAKPGTHRGPVL